MKSDDETELSGGVIRAWLFGYPRVSVDDREIPANGWASRHARAVLQLLLILPGHRIARDQLLDKLWPEMAPDAALNAFYKAMHGLRRTLEPELARGRGSRFVEVAGNFVSIRPEIDCWIDIDAFHDELQRAQSLPAAARRETIRAALNHYRGDLLQDELYADWPVARREELRQMRDRYLLSLSDLDRAAGEPLQTVPLLEHMLVLDDAAEEFHRALMASYASAGRRGQALRQFELCRDALSRAFDTDPSRETEQLAALIRDAPIEPAEPSAIFPVGRISERFENVPAVPTPTIGRDQDIDAIEALFEESQVRLVTITGPGGIGKTRLATEVAGRIGEEYGDGVAFVSLAATSDHSLVFPAIAKTLGVREAASDTILGAVIDHLRDRAFLLILDNFEHLLDAAPSVAELLSAARNLRVLVTSRERIDLRGEHDYRLDVLEIPRIDRLPGARAAARIESVALFVQTLRASLPGFALTDENTPAVAELCARLDGLPLAIELAAARARHVPPQRLLEQIRTRLDLHVRGFRDLPERQRTIYSVVDWSYQLLNEEQQALLRQLGVFAGGFELDAMLAVCGKDAAPLLYDLVDKSLVKITIVDGEQRFMMLETIRAFAEAVLQDQGETDAFRQRHAAFFVEFSQLAKDGMSTPDQVRWLDRLDRELENMRRALGWMIDHGDQEGALTVTGKTGQFWNAREHGREMIAWVERALALPVQATRDSRALAAYWIGRAYSDLGDLENEERSLEIARTLWEAEGNRWGLGNVLTSRSAILMRQGRFAELEQLLHEALAIHREVNNTGGIVNSLVGMGSVARYGGRHDEGADYLRQALSVAESAHNSHMKAFILAHLCEASLYAGDRAGALGYAREGERLCRLIDLPQMLSWSLAHQAMIAHEDGESDRAFQLAVEAMQLQREGGYDRGVGMMLLLLANIEIARGAVEPAIVNLGRAIPLLTASANESEKPQMLETAARLVLAIHQPAAALRLLGAAAARREALDAAAPPFDLQTNRATESAARACAGSEADAALTAGRALNIEDALAMAKEICTSILGKPVS